MEFLRDLMTFIKERKIWWLVPVILVILLSRYTIDIRRIVSIRFFHLHIILILMKNKTGYDTALSIVLLLSIIYFISGKPLFTYIGFALGVLTLLSDTINYYVSYIWKRMLAVLGTVNAHVILSLVFFIVLFPIAALYRLFNKDPLNLKKSDSAFVVKDKAYEAADLENPW